VKRAPCIEAVNRDGQIACGGQRELSGENVQLFFQRRAAEICKTRIVGRGAIEYPAIETDLTDDGVRMRREKRGELFKPIGAAIADMPWMKTKAGANPRVLLRQLDHARPVALVRAVHDGAA